MKRLKPKTDKRVESGQTRSDRSIFLQVEVTFHNLEVVSSNIEMECVKDFNSVASFELAYLNIWQLGIPD